MWAFSPPPPPQWVLSYPLWFCCPATVLLSVSAFLSPRVHATILWQAWGFSNPQTGDGLHLVHLLCGQEIRSSSMNTCINKNVSLRLHMMNHVFGRSQAPAKALSWYSIQVSSGTSHWSCHSVSQGIHLQNAGVRCPSWALGCGMGMSYLASRYKVKCLSILDFQVLFKFFLKKKKKLRIIYLKAEWHREIKTEKRWSLY